MNEWVPCSCGNEIPKSLAEIGVGKYSCSRNIKHTKINCYKFAVSTTYFPHCGGEQYETLVFDSFGPQRSVVAQEWDFTEELAIATHNRLVERFSA